MAEDGFDNNGSRSIEQETVKNCPLLFKMYRRPMNETCISFGFECGEGWHDAIANACKEIETYNNIIYPRWRVRIQADQIKEKYGTLRFYYSIVVDPNPFFTKLYDFLTAMHDRLAISKIKFNLVKHYDIEPFEYETTNELTKEEYERRANSRHKASNVTFKEEDGRYLEIARIKNYGKWHYEPTKNKFLWKMKEWCNKFRFLIRISCVKSNLYTSNAIEFLDRRASCIIRDLEKECTGICEQCGNPIGTSWSPSCQTTGWIEYLCEDCAKKSERNYYKNGELWNKTTLLRSKEDLEKDEAPSKLTEEHSHIDHAQLLRMKTNDKVCVNSKYVCTIVDANPFSSFEKDSNSGSYFSSAKVIVENYDDNATLNVALHPTLSCKFSSNICLLKDNGYAKSLITIADVKMLK